MGSVKPGVKTTEFWLALATAIYSAVEPALPALAKVVVPAVVSAAYAISRGIAKSGVSS